MANTRGAASEDTHAPAARTALASSATGPQGQPHLADAANPRATAAGDLVAADPGLQSGGRPLPVAIGDQQGAALLPRPGHHRPRAGGGHRPPAQAEHHQIHAVHQHRGHLDRIGTGFGDDRDPAQVRSHFDGRQQTDVGLADDRGMPALRRHRRHHAQRQRPGARQHRHRPARQRRGKHGRPAIRAAAAKIPSPAAGRSTALRRGARRPTLPDTAAILRRRCSTCSARLSRRCSRLIAAVTAAPPASSESRYVRIYVRYSE